MNTIPELIDSEVSSNTTSAEETLYNTLFSDRHRCTSSCESKIVFVDTENIKSYEFLEELCPQDSIHFVYTDNSPGLKFRNLDKVLSTGVKCEFINSISGFSNALDFVLVSSMTEYIVENKNSLPNIVVYVVSNDKGYFSSVKYLADKYEDLNIFIVNTVKESVSIN